MTNKQAIEELNAYRNLWKMGTLAKACTESVGWQMIEALDMAIEALQQQGDLLDRNDLYDSFKHDDDGSEWSMGEILSRIQNFPSAKETEDFLSEQYQDIDDYPDTEAIEALSCSEEPNRSDLISRQDAIDACKHAWAKGLEPSQYIELIPSAQPEKSTTEKKSQLAEEKSTCDLIRRQAAIKPPRKEN